MEGRSEQVDLVRIAPEGLDGLLGLPQLRPMGLIIFAHGSGSGRRSPRNTYVAAQLRHAGFATLLVDLLKPAAADQGSEVFDAGKLADRLLSVTRWARADGRVSGLPIGYFGSSAGAATAIIAAANPDAGIAAIVSRGGRPDLAGPALDRVRAPTLLIVGGNDRQVMGLNRAALDRIEAPKDLVVIPGAGHLFEERGALGAVAQQAIAWFGRWLGHVGSERSIVPFFQDRHDAGRQLGSALQRFKGSNPIVLALPRGGVPVGYEIARALGVPLGVFLVRKIGAPGQPELAIGSVIDGADPKVLLNPEIVQAVGATPAYIEQQSRRELVELERRRLAYRGTGPAVPVAGRTIILVDDGIATGATVRAVLQALARQHPARLIVAVPVAPRDVVTDLAALADEVVCLQTPHPFEAVGAYYWEFGQTGDAEVIDLLHRSAAVA